MDDFNFFLKITKPMILNLPDAKDRAMAALWLKKLCEANAARSSEMTLDNNIYVEFLKLMTLVLQGNRLTGIFQDPPPSGDLHELLKSGQGKAKDMMSLIKGRKSKGLGEKSFTEGHPRVITSIGGDMCEYVAVQEIPNFGIHGYYALSTEPLSKWTNPQSSSSVEPDVASACFKNTCKSLGIDDRDNDDESTAARPQAGGLNFEETLRKKHEKTRHSEKSLQKIFQSQRSEIAGVETRPCWGRSRYIDRLIDESPHLVGDIDLSEADALLHLYRDRKLRKVKNDGRSNQSSKACSISSRRRQVETRLDMPPCASIPVEDPTRDQETSDVGGSRTCVPQNLDLDSYHSENEDYYPTDPIDTPRSTPQDYDCNCMDDQCESELVERTDYDNWENYGYEFEEYVDDFPRSINQQDSHVTNPSMTTSDTDAFREMRRLVADPNRRAPPSRGKIKAPRRKSNLPVIQRTDGHMETWDPPGHSTTMHH